MMLVPDWKKCWKWISMHCMVVAGAIQGAWLYIPDDMKTSIPPKLISTATMVLLLVGVLGRLIKQGKKR